jgi:hypothetical protein
LKNARSLFDAAARIQVKSAAVWGQFFAGTTEATMKSKRTIFAVLILFVFASSAGSYGDTNSISSNGINSAGLQLPNGMPLDGTGMASVKSKDCVRANLASTTRLTLRFL